MNKFLIFNVNHTTLCLWGLVGARNVSAKSFVTFKNYIKQITQICNYFRNRLTVLCGNHIGDRKLIRCNKT